MTDEELPSIGMISYYVSLVREDNPDVEGSRQLLKVFCETAKQNQGRNNAFPEPLLELLVSAFERYLNGEELDIEKSLGLKRRGRPRSEKFEKRNHFIAADVAKLVMEDVPLVPNAESDGAFYIVAESYALSEGEVRDIYYRYKDEGTAIAKILPSIE